MKCPNCGILVNQRTGKVLESRPTPKNGPGIRRRRECGVCKVRFTTMERVVPTGNKARAKDDDNADLVIGCA